jgi:hypothetical protein
MTIAGGTRAGSAAKSQRVKQELVKLLYGKQYRKTGQEGHRTLDYSLHSYNDLKKAYYERLQIVHPDKRRNVNTVQQERDRKEFRQLQHAWCEYDAIMKSMMKVAGGDGESANFTLFGVGCSFSDNESERSLRNEITDQACRGWFSSGLLTEPGNHTEFESGISAGQLLSQNSSLIDDSLFVEGNVAERHDQDSNCSKLQKSPRTLIAGVKQICLK